VAELWIDIGVLGMELAGVDGETCIKPQPNISNMSKYRQYVQECSLDHDSIHLNRKTAIEYDREVYNGHNLIDRCAN